MVVVVGCDVGVFSIGTNPIFDGCWRQLLLDWLWFSLFGLEDEFISGFTL